MNCAAVHDMAGEETERQPARALRLPPSLSVQRQSKQESAALEQEGATSERHY